MSATQARHAAPLPTRYRPEPVNFARHRVTRVRRPNRRGIVWHLDNIAAGAVLRIGERGMRSRRAAS